MLNGKEVLQVELESDKLVQQYFNSDILERFLSVRQKRRYHDGEYKDLVKTPVNIRAFDLPNFHLFSVEALGEPYFGQKLLDLLTLAKPRNKGERVYQIPAVAIMADWVIPDQPENYQRLLDLHQRLKKKWDDFISGDRHQYMRSLIYPKTDLAEIGLSLDVDLNKTMHEITDEPKMKPHLLWATSKSDGSRYYLISEDLPQSLAENLDPGANRRLGLLLAAAVSPLQRDTMPAKIALEKDGFEQPMMEAQVPLLVDMYDTLVLRSDLFRNVERSTGIVSSTLLKPPTLAQLLKGEVEDSMYFLDRFKRKALPKVAAIACYLGLVGGAVSAVGGVVDGVIGEISVQGELDRSYPSLNQADLDKNSLEVSNILKDYENSIKGIDRAVSQVDLESQIQKIEDMRNKLETPVLRRQLKDKLVEERNLDLGPIKANRHLVAFLGGVVLFIGSAVAWITLDEKGLL